MADPLPDLVIEAGDAWCIFRSAFLEGVDHFLVCDVVEGLYGLFGEGMGRRVCIRFLVGKPGCCEKRGFVLGVCYPGGVLGVWAGAFEGGDCGLADSPVPCVEPL